MFACRFPKKLRITNHAEAFALWEKSPKKKGYSDPDWRDPFGRPRDNTVVRKDRHDNIHFRLYSTDVVTVAPDDTVTLEPVATPSTANFVYAVLGGHLVPHWADRQRPCPRMMTEVGGKFYHTPDYAAVKFDKNTQQWQLLAGDRSVDVPTLNMSLTREARKDSRYDDFALWIKTQLRLGVDPRMGDTWRTKPYDWSTREVSQYLAVGPEGWAEMTRRMSRRTHVNADLDALRRAVYKWAGYCLDETEVPYFNSYGEMTAAFSRMRKYG